MIYPISLKPVGLYCRAGHNQTPPLHRTGSGFGDALCNRDPSQCTCVVRATIGEGTIINSGAQIATHTQLGKRVIVNRGALIGHHNTIHDYATISPGANLAGNVTIGARAYVGLGANILEKRTIGNQALVGAGALVTHNVPDRTKVMGAPSRVIETEIDGL